MYSKKSKKVNLDVIHRIKIKVTVREKIELKKSEKGDFV